MVWQSLKSDKDCRRLLSTFGGFHDGCLREVHVWTRHFVTHNLQMAVDASLDTQARFLFQRQFENPSAIELHFQEVSQFHLHPSDENYDSIILNATLKLENDVFDFDAEGMIQVIARQLSWRDVSEWMGPELRYRSPDI